MKALSFKIGSAIKEYIVDKGCYPDRLILGVNVINELKLETATIIKFNHVNIKFMGVDIIVSETYPNIISLCSERIIQ